MEFQRNSWGGGITRSHKFFETIIAPENLFSAWKEFRRGKTNKLDIQKFSLDLEDNLFKLHKELMAGSYRHSDYTSFYVRDPKLRHIHKACVADRVLHQAAMRAIEPVFEKTFIFDSYSSRKGKGTHRAVKRLMQFAWKLSRNNTRTVWVLQCDIRKFFDSVDHQVLIGLLKEKIRDGKTMILLAKIIRSFKSYGEKGIPLGNVTSQLFSNIYLNPFDQFLKRNLRLKYYLRYADDFAALSRDPGFLQELVPVIDIFLRENLKLNLHPKKTVLRKWRQGIDFLGYVVFPYHRILRTKTGRRMFKKLQFRKQEMMRGERNLKNVRQCLMSYFGMLKHANSFALRERLKSFFREARRIWQENMF